MAQNEMKAKSALPERVRSMEGLGRTFGRMVHVVGTLATDWPTKARPLVFLGGSATAIGCQPLTRRMTAVCVSQGFHLLGGALSDK